MLAESVNEFRKSMLEQMAMIEQLERSSRLTLAEIAHDLRTPLTSLIMYLDFAQKEIEGRETTAELYLARAREKSARLKNLLDQNYQLHNDAGLFPNGKNGGAGLRGAARIFGRYQFRP